MRTSSVIVKFPLSITYEDAERSIDLDCRIEATINPGDPGCYRTPNGDGWPATGPSIDLLSVTIADTDCEGDPVNVTPEMHAYCREYLEGTGRDRLFEAACESIDDCNC